VGKDRKLVYIREDFIDGTFTIEEAHATLDELIKEDGSDGTAHERKERPQALVRPRIEAIHAGPTKNWTFYSAEKLKGDPGLHSGVYSWSYPYPKPMLKNHDSRSGEPLGRIHSAEFVVETPQAKRPGIIVTPDILDEDAAAKVRDGRYRTVSIGAHTDAVTCSICGWDILNDGRCPDHERGTTYENQTAMWTLGNIWFDELSFVNVPADQDAMVIEVAANDDTPAVNEDEQVPEDHEVAAVKESAEPESDAVDEEGDETPDNPDNDQAANEEAPPDNAEEDDIEEDYEPTAEDKLDMLVYLAMVSAGIDLDQDDTVVDEAQGGDDPNRPKGKDGKPIGKMKTGNQKQAYYGHNLLHGWWNKGSSNWTKDQIKKEHARVVRVILEKGWKHNMIDGLDRTLPGDLQSRSKANASTEPTVVEHTAELEKKVSSLERQLASATKENQTLLRENAELETRLHVNLAEQVVDLKAALSKPGIEDHEAAMAEHITRTADSLRDMLADLIKEARTLRSERETAIERVTNPGLVGITNEPNTVVQDRESDTVETVHVPLVDNTERQINTLKKMFAPKRL
jgi:regulator of replication initiation timing